MILQWADTFISYFKGDSVVSTGAWNQSSIEWKFVFHKIVSNWDTTIIKIIHMRCTSLTDLMFLTKIQLNYHLNTPYWPIKYNSTVIFLNKNISTLESFGCFWYVHMISCNNLKTSSHFIFTVLLMLDWVNINFHIGTMTTLYQASNLVNQGLPKTKSLTIRWFASCWIAK